MGKTATDKCSHFTFAWANGFVSGFSAFQGLNLNIVEIVPPRFRGQRFTLYKPLSLSDENSKSEEEREAERKEKAKQRRSRTNFSLEQVPDAAVFLVLPKFLWKSQKSKIIFNITIFQLMFDLISAQFPWAPFWRNSLPRCFHEVSISLFLIKHFLYFLHTFHQRGAQRETGSERSPGAGET